VDSDEVECRYLEKLRECGLFVCAIKDDAPYSFPCHMVVNGDADAEGLDYESSSGDTVFLLGPKYSLLRQEFWQLPEAAAPEAVQNVLVTMGGADPFHLTAELLNLLDTLPGSFSVSAIIGPFFSEVKKIEDAVRASRRKMTLYRSPDSVCGMMMEADLAISAGGQTLYELACAGCPTVALRIAANQDGQLGVFERAGFLKVAGPGDGNRTVERVRTLVTDLLFNPRARAEMGRAGREMVDGRGGLRVAKEILSETGLSGEPPRAPVNRLADPRTLQGV
jgi:spore coat polysaccharide biosynthesis predicted glycosyltransferase SpsG